MAGAVRRCTLCGLEKESGAGTRTFVCDACLGLEGRTVFEVMGRFITADEITSFLSQESRVPTTDLGAFEIDADILAMIPRALCEKHSVVAVSRAGSSLIVAVTDPRDEALLATLREATGMLIEPVIASAESIQTTLARIPRAR